MWDSTARRRDYLGRMLFELCTTIGVRDSGTRADELAAECIRRELERSCDRVELQPVTFERWLLDSKARLSVGANELECYPYYGSPATPRGGVTGIVCRPLPGEVALSALEAYLLVDHADRRSLAILTPGPFGPAVPRFIGSLAARGLPAVGVSRASLALLESAAAEGRSARLELQARTIGGARTGNLVGTINGTGRGEILLIAHRDTQYSSPGANDNAASLIVMLLLAERIRRSRPRHTFTFLASGAEEIGCLGARAYAELRKENRTLDRISLCLNFDSLTYGIHPQLSSPNAALAEALAGWFRANNRASRPMIFPEPDTLDGAPFVEAGIPTVYLNSRGDDDSKLKLWHRSEDTPEAVDLEVAELFYRSIADFLDEREAWAT